MAGHPRARLLGSPQAASTRKLTLEALEDRSPLAIASFEVNLYADDNGAPGAPLAGDTVEVGQSFFVEITARESVAARAGLRAVALNIAWRPEVLTESDPGFDINQVLTANLPAFRSGTLDNAAGTIDNLAGSAITSSGLGRAIGNLSPERFALLKFTATQAGVTPLELVPGMSGIVTVPVGTLSGGEVSFERQTITVVPHRETEAGFAPVDDTPIHDPPEDAPASEPLAPAVPPVAAAPVAETPESTQSSGDAADPPADEPAEVGTDDPATDAVPDWFLNDDFVGPWELAYILPPTPTETLTELQQSAHAAIDAVFAEWQQAQAAHEAWLDGVDQMGQRSRHELESSALVAHLLHYLATMNS